MNKLVRETGIPADADPMRGKDFDVVMSQTPSLCPRNSLTMEQVMLGALKLDTILLVWAFSLWLGFIFWAFEAVNSIRTH